MKKHIKKLRKLAEESDLKKAVAQWLEEQADYDSVEIAISNLLQGGCVSGVVSNLIYYSDTVKFHDEHHDDIWDLLEEQSKEFGYDSVLEFIGTFQGSKNVGSEDQFKNLLSWYAFEETARQLSYELGIDV